MTIKKISEYFIRYIFVFLILGVVFLEPVSVKAMEIEDAETLQDLKDILADLKRQKRENEQKGQMTENEITQKQQEIQQANTEIANAKHDIEMAKGEIEDYNRRINELNEQTQELMAFYQIMSGNNAYMEFITDSSSMTELIMRSDAIEQLSNYNQDKLLELEELIQKNEQLQVDLIEKQNDLQNLIVEHEKKIDELEGNLDGIYDVTESIDDKIGYAEDQIAYYEEIGCEDDDILSVCEGGTGYNSTWLKPLTKAYVSSAYGWRSFNGGSWHDGIDLAGISEGTPIYSIGTGVVRAVRDSKSTWEQTGKISCGGNIIYIEYNILGKTYTAMYVHVLDINVSVGDKVTPNTVIATVGGGPKTWKWDKGPSYKKPCTTGTHLHFQLSEGVNLNVDSNDAHSIEPPGYPNKGVWFYSRTQWFD